MAALVMAVAAGARGTWSPCGLSMISAINPIAEGARGHRYWLTCAWFVGGAVAGGAILGAGAATIALLLQPLGFTNRVGIGVVASLVCLGSDLGVVGRQLPMHPRQVDEEWLMRYRRWVYALGFGAQIGVGFATYIMTAGTYLFAALAALSAEPYWAMLAGLTFGAMRGCAVLLTARVRRPADLMTLHRRLDALAPWSLRAVELVQAAVVGLLGWSLIYGSTGGEAGGAARVAIPLAVIVIVIVIAIIIVIVTALVVRALSSLGRPARMDIGSPRVHRLLPLGSVGRYPDPDAHAAGRTGQS
ncbi:hypothetical protein SAMN05892883_0631 [Jatrophihabitans sp. GAS493]|nr:hypothetical protein SAMN05892883_0631 [Jatrophihabitans sp. GAS493]